MPHQPPQGRGSRNDAPKGEGKGGRKRKSMDEEGEREKEIKEPKRRFPNSREKRKAGHGVKSKSNEVRPFGRKQWWSQVTRVYCMVLMVADFTVNRWRLYGNTNTAHTGSNVGLRMLPSAGRNELDGPRKGQYYAGREWIQDDSRVRWILVNNYVI